MTQPGLFDPPWTRHICDPACDQCADSVFGPLIATAEGKDREPPGGPDDLHNWRELADEEWHEILKAAR